MDIRSSRFIRFVATLTLLASTTGVVQAAGDPAASVAAATAGSSQAGASKPSLVPKPSAPDPKPFTLQDRFFDAARRGDLDMLKVCLDKGVDPKIEDEVGRNAVALAVRDARDLEMVEFLQSKGVALDDPDAVGRTALHEAAGQGDTAIVAFLLKHGAKIDRKDMQGRTPLHSAVMGGSLKVTEMLLAAGADANTPDNFGDTPLIAVCTKGIDAIAKLLVEKGADPKRKDQEGRMASERADENATYCRSLGPVSPPIPMEPVELKMPSEGADEKP